MQRGGDQSYLKRDRRQEGRWGNAIGGDQEWLISKEMALDGVTPILMTSTFILRRAWS